MNNIKIFKEFWYPYTEVLSKVYNRNDENIQIEKLEDLIHETKTIFIKNTQKKTGIEFTSLELAEVAKIVDSFIKS